MDELKTVKRENEKLKSSLKDLKKSENGLVLTQTELKEKLAAKDKSIKELNKNIKQMSIKEPTMSLK